MMRDTVDPFSHEIDDTVQNKECMQNTGLTRKLLYCRLPPT